MFAQRFDVVIVGGGGAGLRAAIEVARSRPTMTVALVSKVYPVRSHTVAAEGGSAGVIDAEDSTQAHFNDTVSGGDCCATRTPSSTSWSTPPPRCTSSYGGVARGAAPLRATSTCAASEA